MSRVPVVFKNVILTIGRNKYLVFLQRRLPCKPCSVIKRERPVFLRGCGHVFCSFNCIFCHIHAILFMYGSLLWGKREWADGRASDSCRTCLASRWDRVHCCCNKAIPTLGVPVQSSIFNHFHSEMKGAWHCEPSRTRGHVVIHVYVIFQTYKGFLVWGIWGSPHQSSAYVLQPRWVQYMNLAHVLEGSRSASAFLPRPKRDSYKTCQ